MSAISGVSSASSLPSRGHLGNNERSPNRSSFSEPNLKLLHVYSVSPQRVNNNSTIYNDNRQTVTVIDQGYPREAKPDPTARIVAYATAFIAICLVYATLAMSGYSFSVLEYFSGAIVCLYIFWTIVSASCENEI